MSTKKHNALPGTYEAFEAQLARDLGLSCSLDRLRHITNTAKACQSINAAKEERDLDRLFAGKTRRERIALIQASRERVRKFLGLRSGSPVPPSVSAPDKVSATVRGIVRRRSL